MKTFNSSLLDPLSSDIYLSDDIPLRFYFQQVHSISEQLFYYMSLLKYICDEF